MKLPKPVSFLLTSVAAGLAAALALAVLKPDLLNKETTTTSLQPFPMSTLPAVFPDSGPDSYADSVARAVPSVVNIYTTKITTEHKLKLLEDPLFRRFFGKRYSLQPRTRRENSLGSGVIVSPEGYVLTNNHIIDGADEIELVLANGKNVPVHVVGADPDTDLAVLQIESGSQFPVIVLGDSRRLRVGDVVFAIGNPFGVGQTVTMGIVSATGRNHLGINTYENFIQTDAAINPGNSGGALINARGEMVGINTAIFSRTGGYQGIGFAIPVALAKGVMQQITQRGHVTRGWLGIAGQDVTPELAESFGLHETNGILVSRVLQDGPADLAGVRPGDVITHLDGIIPQDMQDVLNIIAGKPPGNRMRLQGWRGDDKLDLVAIIMQRPKTENEER